MMELLGRIERYMRARGISPSRFGREAANDPGLVRDLRNGRELRRTTQVRLARYLDRQEGRRP
jgi:hypothetical protein